MASIVALESARGQLEAQIDALTQSIQQNRQNLQRLQAAQAIASSQTDRAQLQSQIQQVRAQIAADTAALQRLLQELADINLQITEAEAQQGPRESAGQTVAQAQRANDDRADVVSPAAPPPPLGGSTQTNAQAFQPNFTAGTAAPLKPITTSQSLPPATALPGAARQIIAPPNYPGQVTVDPFGGFPSDDQIPTTNAGSGAASDDATGGAGVRATLNNLFAGDITPSPNVLDQYASYTYNISIYLMSATDYANLIKNPLALPKGAQLILQSGGAPIAGGTLPTISAPTDAEGQAGGFYGDTTTTVLPDLGRNPNFPLDYYLDDVRVTSAINGKATGISHNVVGLKFKVVESNGITFLDNLYAATDQYVKLSGTPQVNYAAQNYLMVIRFYGYDKDGNLVLAQKQPFVDPISNKRIETTVEKFIPFQFTSIKFRVANKIVEYDCEAVCPMNNVATSPARGTIPYNVELTSQNLKDLLQGKETFSAGGGDGRQAAAQTDTRLSAKYSIPAVGTNAEFENQLYGAGTTAGTFGTNAELDQALGRDTVAVAAGASSASAPPKASASTSKTLITGLADALNRAAQEWVDKGTYEFADRYFIEMDPVIAQAKVVPPGSTNLSFVPMSPNDTARQKALPATQSVDNNARKFSILAGTSVVQFLDQVVRNSSYIYDQQTKYYDPKPPHELITNGVPANITGWYRISMQVVPQGANRYDRKRNDYAYDITYKIEIYAINDAKSDFFPGARYRGAHKRYDYWFTGQNTQILDYQQDFNYLYYIVQNSKAPVRTRTTNWREVPRFSAQPRSGQTDQMNTGPVSEPGAQLADYLYSPGDTSKIKLRIVGDPSWIQQGDVRGGLPRGRMLYGPFLPDGTINYAGQEILFEVLWNKPADYDLSTGLMDPGTKNYKANRLAGKAGDAVQTYVYRANICTSTFSRGRFEQELEGSAIMFELPQAKQQAAEKQEQTAQAKATNYRNPLIDVPQANPGLLDLDTGSGGEVNYNPTSLAAIKDSQRPKNNLTTSSLAAEGFGDEALGLSQTTAPTSSTQVVGPAATGSAATQTLGGASGRAAGSPPIARLYLDNDQVVEVTSQAEIQQYVNQSSPQARNAASARLNIAQQAANSPTTAAPKQKIARDF